MARKVYIPNTKADAAIDKILSELYLLKTVVDVGKDEEVKSKIDSIRTLLLEFKKIM